MDTSTLLASFFRTILWPPSHASWNSDALIGDEKQAQGLASSWTKLAHPKSCQLAMAGNEEIDWER